MNYYDIGIGVLCIIGIAAVVSALVVVPLGEKNSNNRFYLLCGGRKCTRNYAILMTILIIGGLVLYRWSRNSDLCDLTNTAARHEENKRHDLAIASYEEIWRCYSGGTATKAKLKSFELKILLAKQAMSSQEWEKASSYWSDVALDLDTMGENVDVSGYFDDHIDRLRAELPLKQQDYRPQTDDLEEEYVNQLRLECEFERLLSLGMRGKYCEAVSEYLDDYWFLADKLPVEYFHLAGDDYLQEGNTTQAKECYEYILSTSRDSHYRRLGEEGVVLSILREIKNTGHAYSFPLEQAKRSSCIGDEVAYTITNDTTEELDVLLGGPTTTQCEISERETKKLKLRKGYYQIAVRVVPRSDQTIRPYYGEYRLSGDCSSTFVIDVRRENTPAR